MGEIIRISCEKCDFEKKIKMGAGMMSIRADVVEQNLHGKDLEQWQGILREKKVRFFSWEYEPALCDICNELQSCFVVKIDTIEGKKICLGRKCKICQNEAREILQSDDIKCPNCGQAGINSLLIGNWD